MKLRTAAGRLLVQGHGNGLFLHPGDAGGAAPLVVGKRLLDGSARREWDTPKWSRGIQPMAPTPERFALLDRLEDLPPVGDALQRVGPAVDEGEP